MLKLKLLWIGKTKEKYLEQGLAEYQEKLKPYAKLEVHILKEAPYASLTPKEAMEREGQTLLKAMTPDTYWFVLDERGKEFSSRGLAQEFQALMNRGQSSLGFIIGGAWGLDPAVKAQAKGSLSLSKMTFTHQMVRLFLLEQLYRGMTILAGEKYHND